MWRKDSPLLVVVGVVTYLFLGPSSVLLDGLGQQYSLVLGHRAVLLQLGDYLEPRVKSWRKTVIRSGSRVGSGRSTRFPAVYFYISTGIRTHAHSLTRTHSLLADFWNRHRHTTSSHGHKLPRHHGNSCAATASANTEPVVVVVTRTKPTLTRLFLLAHAAP